MVGGGGGGGSTLDRIAHCILRVQAVGGVQSDRPDWKKVTGVHDLVPLKHMWVEQCRTYHSTTLHIRHCQQIHTEQHRQE